MLTKTFVVMGLVGLAASAQATINVGIVSAGSANMSGPGVMNQLNDNTWGYGFNASIVGPGDVDSLAECQAYDVLVLGDSGFNDDSYTAPMFAAIKSFLQGGGGVVTTGFYVYSNSGGGDADYISPANLASSYGYVSNGAVVITNGSHPVTLGVNNFGPVGAAGEFPNAGGDGTALALGTLTGSNAIFADDTTGGCSVYLGHAYLGQEASYGSANLRTGDADHLLENAVNWAACQVPTPGAATLLGLGGLVSTRRRR